MGNLASSTLQRAASEILRFPSTTKAGEKRKTGECGAGRFSDQATFPKILQETHVEGKGSAGIKRGGSCGTLDQCGTGGEDKGNQGPDKSTPKMSTRHGVLSRSLADRIESPEFTPFGGSTVREQPTLVPVPVERVTPAVPFDANFMVCGTTRAAGHDESSEKSRTSTFETSFARKPCDNCVRRKTRCDGNPCTRCIQSHKTCTRSGLKEVMPPRCRREGCPEPPRHGRRGGRPVWCQLHYVSQNPHEPLRCAVPQRTVSGDSLACWKETTWGWPGKAPTRCEGHKAEGQKRLELLEVVSLLRGVFAQVVWPELLERGWREEKVRCKSPYSLWMPPNVFRGTKDSKARVDYFDTVPQAIKYCLRTEEHHGWMMKVYQYLAQRPTARVVPASLISSATEKLPPVAGGKDTSYPSASSPRGGVSITQHERRKEPQQPSPATTRAFTHQLFSVASYPERAEHDGNGGGSGSSSVTDSFYPIDGETRPAERPAHLGLPQPTRPDTPAYRSHRAARLRAEGLDPAFVTRMGLACSEEVLAGCLARMEGAGTVGGPMAALAASLRGFDGSVSGQEHAAASAPSSSLKRRSSEVSDSDMNHMQPKRSRDLAHRSRELAPRPINGQSFIAPQTQRDG